MQENKRTYNLTLKQTKAADYLTNKNRVAVCFGGAKGGGKSYLFCLWVVEWVKTLIEFFKLEPSVNPLPLGFIGRKRSVDFTKTTFETFKKIIPTSDYEIKEQDKEIILYKRAKAWYGGLDDQININKFNSAELAFLAIDQAEETIRKDVAVLQASLRLVHNGKTPPYKELYTANPADCWLKYDFVYGKRKDGVYIPALYSENPYLPKNYIDTLETAFSYDPTLLAAYRDGDWELIQAEHLVITPKMVENLKSAVLFVPYTKRLIACDPSRGGDECVIMIFENTKIIATRIMHERDTRLIEDELMNLGSQYNTKNFVIDGIGNDIADGLQRKKQHVIRVMSGNTSNLPDKYANIKTEIYMYTAQEILQRNCYPIEDEETVRQLTNVKYRIVRQEKIAQIEPKLTVKKRLGRSPDRGDCYCFGIWGLQYVPDTNDVINYRVYAPSKYRPTAWQGRRQHAHI